MEWSPTQIVSVGSVKYGRQRVNLIAVKLSHWTVPIIALTNKVGVAGVLGLDSGRILAAACQWSLLQKYIVGPTGGQAFLLLATGR